MWDPQHRTTLQASTVCYRDRFTFFFTLYYFIYLLSIILLYYLDYTLYVYMDPMQRIREILAV
jgi:hypothetical protein